MNKKTLWNVTEQLVFVEVNSTTLKAEMAVPENAEGIVLFAHGTGNSRYSTRNRYIAHILRQAGLATLLIDLLTTEEETIDQRTQHFRHDVKHLAGRLEGTTRWLAENPPTQHLKIGYFGDDKASCAALLAAAESPMTVDAIVSRGGHTELTSNVLCHIQAPTLLIVGSHDLPTITMNEDTLKYLGAQHKQLEIIHEASHLFDEPGALEEVSRLASQWFKHYLTSSDRPPKRGDLHLHAMCIL